MDKRKTYLIGLDTETANSMETDNKLDLSQSIVYDIGWGVVDKKGNFYEKRSFLVAEIFLDKELMNSAYYKEKIPKYWEAIKRGEKKLAKFETIRRIFFTDYKSYNIKAVFAHNARFDLNALNNTIRLLTGSEKRYFYPKNAELWDTLKMARDIFKTRKGYTLFCEENGYLTNHRPPQNRFTAEVLYKYISGDNTFEEKHMGLEDVEIETKILVYCLNAHQKMRKGLFEK